jgi:lysophospholipase L1-like esterase
MKTILCYGDSLTYGSNPATDGPRHAFEDRWPGALEQRLAGRIRVVPEGLGGRTTIFDDWFANADRNGARILPTLLASHSPLDMVIVMLGTNDLKPFLGRVASEAGRGMGRIVEVIRGHYAGKRETCPEIVLVAPPPMVDTDNADMIGHFGGRDVIAESYRFAHEYERRATEHGVHFFDAGTVAKADPADGVHLSAASTRAIGVGLAPLVTRVLGL